MARHKATKAKKGAVIVSLLLTNIVALILIGLEFGYYDFGPYFIGAVSFEHALKGFLRTEIVLGGGFLILFNGYVIIWNLFLKKKEMPSGNKQAKHKN